MAAPSGNAAATQQQQPPAKGMPWNVAPAPAPPQTNSSPQAKSSAPWLQLPGGGGGFMPPPMLPHAGPPPPNGARGPPQQHQQQPLPGYSGPMGGGHTAMPGGQPPMPPMGHMGSSQWTGIPPPGLGPGPPLGAPGAPLPIGMLPQFPAMHFPGPPQMQHGMPPPYSGMPPQMSVHMPGANAPSFSMPPPNGQPMAHVGGNGGDRGNGIWGSSENRPLMGS